MNTKTERYGTYAVLAIFFTALGGFLGGEFVAQGFEDELALAHVLHTEDILTSLNYFRDGDMAAGYRMMELSLDTGRHFSEIDTRGH